MQTLHIRKMDARYHLPLSAQSQRERLDRVFRDLAENVLEIALERAGVSASEEICIRNLHVPIRLRLSSTDATLAAEWSMVLAEAIRRAASGAVPGIVRYTSRIQAFVDMAVCSLSGKFERAWAWREIGIWRAGDSAKIAQAADEIVWAFIGEPSVIAPVLHALAEQPVLTRTLAALAAALPATHWTRVARAAMEAAHVPAALLTEAEPGVAEISQHARAILRNSALAKALMTAERNSWQSGLTAEATVRRALAVLIVLEADPGVLRTAGRLERILVGSVADALYPSITSPHPSARMDMEEAQREAAHDARLNNPTGLANSTAAQREEARRNGTASAAQQPKHEAADEDAPIAPLRRRAITSNGGLLFLLHIVRDLEIADEISAQPALASRSFRWSMHQLSLMLATGADVDDPAALAFAGLIPDSVPPSRGEPAPLQTERAALESFAARIQDNLRERLERDGETLASITRRQAEIVADPGWVELRLSLSDVSVTVRRAGLDLDLGYVPWLGLVMRFVYE